MYNKILFATDGSKQSSDALSHVIKFAAKFASEVVIAHVYDVPIGLGDRDISSISSTTYFVEFRDHIVKYANYHIDEVKRKLEENDIKSIGILKQGKPGPGIVEIAEEEKCDLVVMGCRGLGAIKSLLLGSTSYYVVHNIKCPVFIVNETK